MGAMIGINELLACIDSFINLGKSAEMDDEGEMHFSEIAIFNKLLGNYKRVCDNCYVDEDNYAFCSAFNLIRRFTKYLSDISENNYTIPGMYVLATWFPLLCEANDNKYRLQNIQNRRFPYFKLITIVNKIGVPLIIKYFHPVERVNAELYLLKDGMTTMIATSPDVYYQIVIEEMAFESKPLKISVDSARNQPMYMLKSTKSGFVAELNEYSD